MFISGVYFIDAPASALNSGDESLDNYDNSTSVKAIKTGGGMAYPYVSAQAFRFWLRTALDKNVAWKAAPIFRENKIAYTDANPLLYWDDDLLGYMRAPSKKKDDKGSSKGDAGAAETLTTDTITRVSPLRVSTLVSIAKLRPTEDFGTMSRHNGDPVPHAHNFYRTVLKGALSLDLARAGVFSYQSRTGYQNLDENRKKQAEEKGLAHDEASKSYALPIEQRTERLQTLIRALPEIQGGAKQALHYTDVSPVVFIGAVIKGGNNPFNYVVGADKDGNIKVDTKALEAAVAAWQDHIQSPLYVGWVAGFAPEQKEILENSLKSLSLPKGYALEHPRTVLNTLADDLAKNPDWLA